MIKLGLHIHKILKKLQFHSPLKRCGMHHYDYFFRPKDLFFLCQKIETCAVNSATLIEVGCAHGATAVFLNKHLDSLLTDPNHNLTVEPAYHCIDTFSGFTEKDIRFECEHRQKNSSDYEKYRINDQKWFDEMLKQNLITRVRSHKADASNFPYMEFGEISFALIDVDLYLPIKKCLPPIYQQLIPGGIIIVDDCKPNTQWDGALEAYQEFVQAHGLPEEICNGKFGVIQKPLN